MVREYAWSYRGLTEERFVGGEDELRVFIEILHFCTKRFSTVCLFKLNGMLDFVHIDTPFLNFL